MKIDLNSPDSVAQAMIKAWGVDAERAANDMIVMIDETRHAHRIPFWRDVATLIRFEAQSDEA